MKIAYYLYLFPKISESFILNEIVNLIRKGHNVHIFSIYEPQEDIMHEEIAAYNILERTHYFKLQYIFKVNLLKFLICFLKYCHLDASNFKISRQWLKKIIRLAYFAVVMDRIGIDLIHDHFANIGMDARNLSKMLSRPYTITTHAFDIYQSPNEDELRKILDDANSVITISEYNKKYLVNEIGVKNQIEIIRCGIDLKKFNIINKQKSNERIRLFTTARLVEKKGMEYLIRAMPTVKKAIPNCELIIVGSGQLRLSLNRLIAELDAGKYIQLIGNVTDMKLLQFFQYADIFILPCIIANDGDRDGIPVVLMEAMAMGLPVISTNVSGIPELIENGVSGVLVPPNNKNAIADAIINICLNKDLRIEMGKNGRKKIENEFNITYEIEKLIKVFNRTGY